MDKIKNLALCRRLTKEDLMGAVAQKQPFQMTEAEYILFWTNKAFNGDISRIKARGEAERLANERVARYSYKACLRRQAQPV